MKRNARPSTLQRAGCATVVASMLAGMAPPALAVSGTAYAGFVSQLPGVYTTPPDPNVMFTLDDSGSMLAHTIPDIPAANAAGMPTSSASNALGQSNATWPGLWRLGSDYYSAEYYRSGNGIARYLRSADGNPIYYDPKVTYRPWPTAANDKALHAAANVRAVNVHPHDPFNGTYQRLDLTQRQGGGGDDDEARNYWPATYYVYRGAAPLPLGNPNAPENTAANFTKFEIKPAITGYPRAFTRHDCSGAVGPAGCTYAEELQNFANWLQYYHTRALMAKGGAAAAFARQGSNLRVGLATLNRAGSIWRAPGPFTGSARQGFYTDLYGVSPNGGTPLRQAVDNVGRFFQRTGAGNPWAEDPASSSVGTEYTCRRSFHILSTDGFWNGADALAPANEDNDSFAGLTPPKPDSTAYTYSDARPPEGSTDALLDRFGLSPFKDNANASHTLADVAAYYWKTDLRADLRNDVASSTRDPAYWQHLSTYTVGLGISGTGLVRRQSDGSAVVPASEPDASPFSAYRGRPWLATQKMRDLLVTTKTPLQWTAPVADDRTTGDDLIHASMVGRGQYFSATNPTDLASGLAAALSEATDQPGDFASLAADSTQLHDGGKVYQAIFSPYQWYGRLYAFRQDATTGRVNNKPTDDIRANADQLWEASNKLPAAAARNVFTSSGAPATGVAFTWANLSGTQKALLNNDPNLVDYLRGDGSRELANGGTFRDRARYTVAGVTGGPLGDIVNGAPIKGPDAGGDYNLLPAGDPARNLYPAYRNGNVLTSLRSTIFFAANDGMLHAVNTADGVERFAYVPNAVYQVARSTRTGAAEAKLAMLADPAYAHRFTVDGPPNVSDAFLGGTWRTLLTASFGAGARGIFALDVTDTAVGAGGFNAGRILWEFTEANHADMGFVAGYPHVVRMRDGTWAAIFGNGYDSASGQAKLFIVNAMTGVLLKEFSVGAAGNNGLGQPNFTLHERQVTAIYAGDLKGNLWKFDVSAPDPARWSIAFGGNPLFRTRTVSGVAQPITVMPELEKHPRGGVVVTFGTGKLFEESDTALAGATPPNVNLQTQSIYGVWDKPGETSGITAAREAILLAQTASSVFASPTYSTSSAALPDWDTQRGWYLDLTAGPSGERVSLAPQIVRNTLFVVANTPQNTPCQNGGVSRVLALDPVTGAAPKFAVFSTGNVMVNANGVMTQPTFQFTGQPAGTTGSATGVPGSRGDVTTARRGGYEPRGGQVPCEALMTAPMEDTTLSQTLVKLCQKRRISWRQLQ